MNLFRDDDDFLTSTPKENFLSIIKNANENIVMQELEKMFARLALAEKILEEHNLEQEYEKRVPGFPFEDSKDYENRLNSLFIETVGNILTQSE